MTHNRMRYELARSRSLPSALGDRASVMGAAPGVRHGTPPTRNRDESVGSSS
jgi:hypothetical protein